MNNRPPPEGVVLGGRNCRSGLPAIPGCLRRRIPSGTVDPGLKGKSKALFSRRKLLAGTAEPLGVARPEAVVLDSE